MRERMSPLVAADFARVLPPGEALSGSSGITLNPGCQRGSVGQTDAGRPQLPHLGEVLFS